MSIPFNKLKKTSASMNYVQACYESGHLHGGGAFTQKCAALLQKQTGTGKAFLTPSCTDALEMMALLLDIQPGDEVIMPSYTFSSSANAVVLRGGVPVFVDIDPKTQNISATAIKSAITNKTKAIMVMHYGGIACAMDDILKMGVPVIEDAAHAYGASYKGRALGTLGQLGAYSFHNTKNISSGEGGALLVNDGSLSKRAEILLEKGTDRINFTRGEVGFYSWRDIGSSFVMSDLSAAFLLGQMESMDAINSARLSVWNAYHEGLASLENAGHLTRPHVPEGCDHNAHLYYILCQSKQAKDTLISAAKSANIGIISHYVPLHSSPAGLRYGRVSGEMTQTDRLADTLLRLPLYPDMTASDIDQVLSIVTKTLKMA